MTVPPGLRALRHRDFRVFFAGQAVALVGSWMQQVAQAWLVLSLTDSPLRLGLVGSLNFIPILLFALVGGAVADRLPKRRLLVLTQSLLFCQTAALALLIVTGHVRYWHICVLALVWGIANTIDLPVRQAFVVELAGRADVTSAVALNSAAFNVARIVGPAVGGLLIARAGVAPAYFINAGAFLVVIGALRVPSLLLLFATGFLSCTGLVVMSTIARFGVAAVVLFALGWVSVMVVAGCQAALQLAAPDRLRGRIMSLHTFIYGGVFPFGAFTVGSISEHWGVSWAFRVAGLFGLTALTLVLVWWRFRTRET